MVLCFHVKLCKKLIDYIPEQSSFVIADAYEIKLWAPDGFVAGEFELDVQPSPKIVEKLIHGAFPGQNSRMPRSYRVTRPRTNRRRHCLQEIVKIRRIKSENREK